MTVRKQLVHRYNSGKLLFGLRSHCKTESANAHQCSETRSQTDTFSTWVELNITQSRQESRNVLDNLRGGNEYRELLHNERWRKGHKDNTGSSCLVAGYNCGVTATAEKQWQLWANPWEGNR